MSYKDYLEKGQAFKKTGNSKHQNAFLGVKQENGTFRYLGTGACHGSLSGGASVKPICIHSWKMPCIAKNAKKEAFFYTWLVNESPWAKAFILKNYKEILEKGFEIRTDLPADYVASACVATRFYTEIYNDWTIPHIETFEDLVDSKVDPLWAFIMSMMYKKAGKDQYTYRMQNGHEIVPYEWTLETIKRFFKGDHKPPQDENAHSQQTFYKRGGYGTIGTAWTEPGTSVKTRAKEWGTSKISAKDLNVFRKPVSTFPVLTLKQLVDLIPEVKKEVEAS